MKHIVNELIMKGEAIALSDNEYIILPIEKGVKQKVSDEEIEERRRTLIRTILDAQHRIYSLEKEAERLARKHSREKLQDILQDIDILRNKLKRVKEEVSTKNPIEIYFLMPEYTDEISSIHDTLRDITRKIRKLS